MGLWLKWKIWWYEKIKVLQIQGVASVPYAQKAQIIAPIIQRMLQDTEGANELAQKLKEGNERNWRLKDWIWRNLMSVKIELIKKYY